MSGCNLGTNVWNELCKHSVHKVMGCHFCKIENDIQHLLSVHVDCEDVGAWKKEIHEKVNELISLETAFIASKMSLRPMKEDETRKFPHKCPLCNGTGEDRSQLVLAPTPKWPLCKVCDGKGIVWG